MTKKTNRPRGRPRVRPLVAQPTERVSRRICADSGGKNKNGDPCGQVAAGPDGRCIYHPLRSAPPPPPLPPAAEITQVVAATDPSPQPLSSNLQFDEQLEVDRPLRLEDIPWFEGEEPAAGDGDITIEPAAEDTNQEQRVEQLPAPDELEPFRLAGRWTPEKAGKLVNPAINMVFEKTGKPKQTATEEKYTAEVFAPVLEDLLSRVDPNSPYGALSLWAVVTIAPRYAADLVEKIRTRGYRSRIDRAVNSDIHTSSSSSDPAAPAPAAVRGDWLNRA